jgi:hypothetical protein
LEELCPTLYVSVLLSQFSAVGTETQLSIAHQAEDVMEQRVLMECECEG